MCKEATASKVQTMKQDTRKAVIEAVVIIHRGHFDELGMFFKALLLKAFLPAAKMTEDELHQIVMFLPEVLAPLIPFYTGNNRHAFLGEMLMFSESLLKERFRASANEHLLRLESMPGSPFNVPLHPGIHAFDAKLWNVAMQIIAKHKLSKIQKATCDSQLDEIFMKLTSGSDSLGPKLVMFIMKELGDGGAGFSHIVDETLRCVRNSVQPFASVEFAKYFIRSHFNTFKSVIGPLVLDDSFVLPVIQFVQNQELADMLKKVTRPGLFKNWSLHQLNHLEYIIMTFDRFGIDPDMLPLLRALSSIRQAKFSV